MSDQLKTEDDQARIGQPVTLPSERATASTVPGFTPGPWKVEPCGDDAGDPQSELWISAPHGDPAIGYQSWSGLAAVYGSIDDPEGRADRQMNANAHLIAAAPDLYAALREYLEWGAMTGSDRDLFEHKFRAALAKAEGRAS